MKESIEVRTPKTRSWKPKRAETIDGKPTTRNTKSKTNKLWPNQGDAVPNISWNLRKKRSSQYWLEQPTMPWESTEQLKTHKPDLQQVPYSLTGEEGKEEQEKEVSLFPVMVRSTAHQKCNEIHRRWGLKFKIWGEGKKHLKNYNFQKYEKNIIQFWRFF